MTNNKLQVHPVGAKRLSGLQADSQGFTLVEMLIVIAIAIILAAVVFGALSSFNRTYVLDGAAQDVLSILTEARTLTLASRQEDVYGVHFEADAVTLFQGSSYSASDPDNEITTLPSAVTISDIALIGGGSDVIFERLTGKTDHAGTVTLSLVADATKTHVINITASGIAEQQ